MSVPLADRSSERPKRAVGGAIPYVEWYRAGRPEHIKLIKSGIAATDAKRILSALGLPSGEAMRAVNLSSATVNRKAKARQSLAPQESERVLGVAKLVGQVQAMVEESGNPDGFDAANWVSRWLREPIPALGGERPVDLLDTMEGQALVSETLARMQSGAYA